MGSEQRARPIVIVTGANAGVGYAICQRLLLQLAQRLPSDGLPQRSIARSISIDEAAEIDLEDFAECEGITLILACRSVSKAEQARKEFVALLDNEVEKIKRTKGGADANHAQSFRDNVDLVVQRIDLASAESVFSFARAINSKYPYVSHLVCNAGVASFIGYDWPLACKQLLTDFLGAVTSPLFKLQRIGELSEDGLGWIWQCNVFGHYMLFRLLEPLLNRYRGLTRAPSRVLWMSSLEANPACYDPEDWQLVRNARSYEASKYQIDLLAGWFEQRQQRALSVSDKKREAGFKDGNANTQVPVRHFLFHPGVVRTNIATKSLNSNVLDFLMQLSFLMAHFLGSRVHVITPYKSAIPAVHLMLVALPFITVASSNLPGSEKPKSQKAPTPLKFGAHVDYWFNEYVGTMPVPEWEERQDQAAELVQHCEELFLELKKKQTEKS
ncbi:uncharacterized protein FOMMEDRAFT_21336 [Fomitiporia mediterranea MF3/22]|uniref:uncharacterized protein n=1 Tax=Fomitiporia mediterranea (strain MF3/22) TaxID=694068 RepID=UPI0004407BDE|nr:uncharacterized protein FOMMEDRAFT_21336 [Fomitiporia mediterranea MF3/22]EJD00851.1 hypothetical protein FOMMEDRAFT_21336 [Fomitiporia mediterranea MF3/22]